MGNAIKDQVIEQGSNLVVDDARCKDLVGEIQGEEEEFRNGDVKGNFVKLSKPLQLSRKKKS